MIVPDRQFQTMRVLSWSLPLFVVSFGGSWGVLAQNIPPYDAAYPIEKLTRHFIENAAALRLGYAIGAISTVFWFTWSIALFGIMRRMEGRDQLLSYVQLMGGSLTALVPMFACIVWLTAAFRPEQDPSIIRMLYDLGWLLIDIGFGPTTIQMAAIAILFLQDQRPVPLFPRWLSWLGIWIGLEFLAEIMMPFFRSGPFSWSGLFNYWIPFGGPFVWGLILTFYMLKAIDRLEKEASTLSPATA